jgi:hypothetical protein
MLDNHFEKYKTRVLKTIFELDQKAAPAALGDTLLRHYFNSGYSEKSAATAMMEIVRF